MRLTPAEVVKGTTVYAARAIGLDHWIGSLGPAKAADFVLFDAVDVREWLYPLRPNACVKMVIGGRWER